VPSVLHTPRTKSSPVGLSGTVALVLLHLANGSGAQDDGGGVDPREAMWPAPTQEDWARPCLITWQRTFEDALVVSRETGKPIMICVNMDGEIASEHYAGIRYRQPDIAALYRPYVSVIASTYRHNPRDFDEEGQRVACPRFGTVTCGEHIAIEPGLFEKYFDGQRVAPRHIMIELDQAETYDVYYAFDTDTIFNALRDGVVDRVAEPTVPDRGDRSLLQRVGSHDSRDREVVERAYLDGDRAFRRTILQEASIRHTEVGESGLLRMALFGEDLELARIAWEALLKSTSVNSIDLICDVLRLPLDAPERYALIDTLERLGESSVRARRLARVHRGLGTYSDVIDVEGWDESIDPQQGGQGGRYTRAHLAGALERELGREGPSVPDPVASLSQAFALLELAGHPDTRSEFSRLLVQDARRAALAAEGAGAEGPRLDACLALVAEHLGEREVAHEHALGALGALPVEVPEWSVAPLLTLFVEARQPLLAAAVNGKEDWPAEWLTDLHAAYTMLARHPFGTDAQAADHFDLLKALGVPGDAARALEGALRRFPDSWLLHDRLRGHLLAEDRLESLNGLEATYEAMLQAKDHHPSLPWFAGYASLVAAEYYRRAGRPERALGAYGRAMAHFESSVELNPGARASADHYIAIALAGRSRLALEGGELERAQTLILSSFERCRDAAGSLDGMGFSPVTTARTLVARLREAGGEELAATLEAVMATLDPEHLKLPGFESLGPDGRPRVRRPGRRRRDG